jgi:radical SAM superfamily enzyme
MYERGEYAPPSLDFYIDAAVHILTHIHPATVVHRLTGDCPDGMLVAPEWNKNKHVVIDAIVAKMMREGLSQGCKYGE